MTPSFTIHDTAKALISGEHLASGANPINHSGLNALAIQLAKDYYAGQLAPSLDEVYPGTLSWVPEGIHDIVWTYAAGNTSTRVMRSPHWNRDISEMQHSTPTVSGTILPPGIGGRSVAQTIRDRASMASGFSTYIDQVNGLSISGMTALLQNISYFPTNQRWFGLVGSGIDSEIVLFEGTSNNPTLAIVYRGLNGTIAKEHPQGTKVSPILPHMVQGVNLTTYDQAQPVFPGQWTSGGIQEAVIQPQTQTVIALGSGFGMSGAWYNQGLINRFDPILGWQSGEKCWLIDRKDKTATLDANDRFPGQFIGFSHWISGAPNIGTSGAHQAAPIYAVNKTGATAWAFIESLAQVPIVGVNHSNCYSGWISNSIIRDRIHRVFIRPTNNETLGVGISYPVAYWDIGNYGEGSGIKIYATRIIKSEIIKITGPQRPDGFYPGKLQKYNPNDFSWQDSQEVLVREINDGTLAQAWNQGRWNWGAY